MRILGIPPVGSPGVAYYRFWKQLEATPVVEVGVPDKVPAYIDNPGGRFTRFPKGPAALDAMLRWEPDFIYAPYTSSVEHVALTEMLRDQTGVPLVVDFDDLVTDVPETNQAFTAAHNASTTRRVWDHYLEMADVVTVSTPTLQRILVPEGKLSVVIPNFSSLSEYAGKRKQHVDVRILFTGASGGHWGEYTAMTPVVEKLVARYPHVKVAVTGYLPVEWTKIPRVYAVRWASDVILYFKIVRHIAPTIGIAPLIDHPFNACKSDIKYQEYALAGAVGVFSDMPPYADVEHRRTGIKVSGVCVDDWVEVLSDLIERPSMIETMARAAAHDVVKNHCASKGLLPVMDRVRCLLTDKQVAAVP